MLRVSFYSRLEIPTPMAKTLAAAFRRQHSAALRDLQPSPGVVRSSLLALSHVAVGVGAAAANVWLWKNGHATAAAVLYPATSFVIGTRFRALCNMMHESVHNTLAATPIQNKRIGQALSLFDFTNYEAYAREHLTHHRYLGDPERDLDFAARRDLFLDGDSKSFLTKHMLRPLTLFHVRRYIDPSVWSKTESLRMRLVRLAYITALALLATFVIGWPALLLFYLVPYATAYQVVRYWSDAVDHAGTLDAPDEFYRARNHISGSATVNWLLFPDSDQYHLVHHLFPAVPAGKLRAAHERLLADPLYAKREHGFGPLVFGAEVRADVRGASLPPPPQRA